MTALAALEEKAIDPSTTVEDQGVLTVGDYQYANWYYTQYGRVEGTVDLLKALQRSNDIYFYKAAEWLGPSTLADYARLFGFGQVTGLELAGEAAGLVPDPAWKEQERGENWYLGNTYHFGIGQGDLLVSPIQIAQLTQAIANRGVLCQATLLADQQQCHDLALERDWLDLVLEGMLRVAESGGTAYPFFPYNSQMSLILSDRLGEEAFEQLSAWEKIKAGLVAGKTGTAEFGAADDRGYRPTHAWFTAIVGLNKSLILDRYQDTALDLDAEHQAWLRALGQNQLPQLLAITVLVESDEAVPFREGSADAAPVAKNIVDWLMLF